jgi:hypothetical protein
MKAEIGVGKTWIKRGELHGFCGQFAGCYRPMVRGLNFLLAELRQMHSRGVKEICYLPLFCSLRVVISIRKMRRIWIDSSSIASIGYEAATRELEIEFRESGDVYRYFDVPEEEYAAFLAADSRGNYLNQVFKERNYRYRLVSRGT